MSHRSLLRCASGRTVDFWSSVEYGTFLKGLERELVTWGWASQQRFAVSECDYRGARGGIARIGMRWASYVSYPRMVARRARREAAPGALVVCTNTFYAPAVAMRAARARGIPVIHWVLDLFPDVLVQAGKLRAGGMIERRLSALTRWTCAHAAANVFLGDRLLAAATQAHGQIPRSAVIPVGADALPFAGFPPVPRVAGAAVRILYCGNFGRMHDTRTIAGLLQEGLPSGCDVEFRGNGAGFAAIADGLRKGAANDRVALGPNLPDAEWIPKMVAADIGLVTMQPGAERLVMPSKTYSAMAAGQAILAICPRASDLADTVLKHDAGWVIEPGDVAGLRQVLTHAVAHPEEVLAKRRNAYHAGQNDYSQATIAKLWAALLGRVTSGAAAPHSPTVGQS